MSKCESALVISIEEQATESLGRALPTLRCLEDLENVFA